MNWAKGRATKGRGTSFKGALRYVLHDKKANTSERVGFVELRNLATDDPHRAWREMMALCDAADDLKKRSGERATGRKLRKPVYAFTLNWHEEDRPSREHMRETAGKALAALGMDHLQAVVVEHNDKPHRHVHIIVNLVHPDTGKAASLSNDEHCLDRWADSYELEQGVVRSPGRRAKFQALDQGRKPPRRTQQAKTREEWRARRKLESDRAKARAAAIRSAYAARVADLKGSHAGAEAARRAEATRLWRSYGADRKAIYDRYQPYMDAIWRKARRKAPDPGTEQAMRDLQESAEWRELGRHLYQERRRFTARESSLLGVIVNAIRMHQTTAARQGIRDLLKLLISRKQRARQLVAHQEAQKLALRERQSRGRRGRVEVLRSARRVELARGSEEFQARLSMMKARHALERAEERAAWRKLAEERDRVWSRYRGEYGLSSSRAGSRSPTPDARSASTSESIRATFNEAAHEPGLQADRSRGDETGKGDRGEGEGQGSSGPKQETGGWRARRPAAERKSDGTYRPRDRGGRDPGRTRRR